MEILSYYASHSVFTDPGANAALLADFPGDPAALSELVQGLCVDFEGIYKYNIQNERSLDTTLRCAEAILGQLCKLDKNTPLNQVRPADDRFVASSSDFATLFVAALRQQGTPARKRTGFLPREGKCRIHDVAEYWDGGAWKRVDPSGRPAADFVPAAEAWQAVRAGKADPADYRDEEREGIDVLRAALMLDLAGMGKRELLVWDRYGWGLIPPELMSERAWRSLDELAELLLRGDEAQEALVALYEREEGLEVPETVRCLNPLVPHHNAALKRA